MANKELEIRGGENLQIKELFLTKKFPFLGSSPNLIDYFYIIGYDVNLKEAIDSNFLKGQNEINNFIPPENMELNNTKTMYKKEKEKPKKEDLLLFTFQTEFKPIVLNNKESGLTNATLNEELIIKNIFINNLVTLYCENKTDEKCDKNEKKAQNIILFLKANKSFSFKSLYDENDEKLKKDLMFNVYAYLFLEIYFVENKYKKPYKIYFPKTFLFISQYPFFQYYSFLSQHISYRMKEKKAFEISLEIQLYNIIKFTPSPINSNLSLEFLICGSLWLIKQYYSKKNGEIVNILKK